MPGTGTEANGEGKVYLSPIIDCFDGMPITWTVGTSPNAELVNTMLDNAIVLLKENEHPIVHSDRGCHYRWSGWIQRMDEAGLTRSMSKKGCSPDNSACEGFFGRMKNEMFYGEKWDKISVEEFISIINQYMQWYRDKRIKLSLGGLSPMEYRRSLGICVLSIENPQNRKENSPLSDREIPIIRKKHVESFRFFPYLVGKKAAFTAFCPIG